MWKVIKRTPQYYVDSAYKVRYKERARNDIVEFDNDLQYLTLNAGTHKVVEVTSSNRTYICKVSFGYLKQYLKGNETQMYPWIGAIS